MRTRGQCAEPWSAGTFELGRGLGGEVRRQRVYSRTWSAAEVAQSATDAGGAGAMRLIPRALCTAARAVWRESFPLGGRDVARWFPGHMAKGEVLAGGGGFPASGSSLVALERVGLLGFGGGGDPG